MHFAEQSLKVLHAFSKYFGYFLGQELLPHVAFVDFVRMVEEDHLSDCLLVSQFLDIRFWSEAAGLLGSWWADTEAGIDQLLDIGAGF